MKLEFSRQIFEKCSNIKNYENPSSESRVGPCRKKDVRTDRQTDRQDEGNSRYRNFANAPKRWNLAKSNHCFKELNNLQLRILGFRNGAAQVFYLLRYEATSLSNWFTTFRSNVTIFSSKVGKASFPVMQRPIQEERITILRVLIVYLRKTTARDETPQGSLRKRRYK
jgi:hypothetical protein